MPSFGLQPPAEILKAVLVYTTEPLDVDLEVTGPVSAVLFAATTARDTDWTVKLVDVRPDGRAINVADGILRARYRESLSDPAPVEPGRVYEYRIELGATSMRFKAGHRIRVEVSSSNYPCYDRNLNTGGPLGEDGIGDRIVATQTVFHDASRPSRVRLPVVPGPRDAQEERGPAIGRDDWTGEPAAASGGRPPRALDKTARPGDHLAGAALQSGSPGLGPAAACQAPAARSTPSTRSPSRCTCTSGRRRRSA